MALTKVTKHIVFGSVLVAHYGKDLTDKSQTSSTFADWGTSATLTPQYTDSHLELVTTGTAYQTSTGITTGFHAGQAQYVVNGNVEYTLRGIIGNNPNRSVTILIRTNSLVKTMVDKTGDTMGLVQRFI